jgi:uncharacterized membrane protein HdeD (DUF308 family)
MALFGPPKNEDYPKRWKEMSLDFKLMFAYHGVMMVLFATGSAFTSRQEVLIAATLIAILTAISMRHRRATNWRWPGASNKNILVAVGGIALTGVFLYAATPLFPPSNPVVLPWFLAGFGIGAINFLQALRLVQTSDADFCVCCGEPNSEVPEVGQRGSTEPSWHRVVRATYSAMFLIVWLGFVAFFYYSGATFRDGSAVPTNTKTEPVTEHGKTVYVTRAEKALSDKLEVFAFVGIPSVMIGGFVLHFLVGIKLFPNTPTLPEYLAKRNG